MGRQWPTLKAADVRAILRRAGFAHKRTTGSHEQWQGEIAGQRRLVTLDASGEPFTPRSDLTKSMIRQSGLSKEEFYGHLK